MRIVHYFSPMSGYAYLGFGALCAMAKRHGVEVEHKPMDIARVFAAVDTIAPARQSPARLAWRRTDMMRWAERRNLPLRTIPKFWPVDATLAACVMIAAQGSAGQERLIAAILSAVWAQDLDIASESALADIIRTSGLDPQPVLASAKSETVKALYRNNTDEAVAAGVIGSPTLFIEGAMFFGQDRFDFAEEQLRISVAA